MGRVERGSLRGLLDYPKDVETAWVTSVTLTGSRYSSCGAWGVGVELPLEVDHEAFSSEMLALDLDLLGCFGESRKELSCSSESVRKIAREPSLGRLGCSLVLGLSRGE